MSRFCRCASLPVHTNECGCHFVSPHAWAMVGCTRRLAGQSYWFLLMSRILCVGLHEGFFGVCSSKEISADRLHTEHKPTLVVLFVDTVVVLCVPRRCLLYCMYLSHVHVQSSVVGVGIVQRICGGRDLQSVALFSKSIMHGCAYLRRCISISDRTLYTTSRCRKTVTM